MTPLATILFYSWIPLCFGLALVWRLPVAVGLIAVLAHAIIPKGIYGLPGPIDLSAISVAGLFVMGAGLFSSTRPHVRLSILDIPMLAWCLCPIPTYLTNGTGIGIAQAIMNFLAMGAFYVAGRCVFRANADLRALLLALAIGGVIYVPLCWYEMRMSPQLSLWLYGYRAQNFSESIRLGGWRPIVFMEHGIITAAWMGLSSLAAVGLWLDDQACGRKSRWWLWLALLLIITFVFCRSAGALVVFGLVGIAYVLVILRKRLTPLLLIALTTAAFLGLRISGFVREGDIHKTAIAWFGQERGSSYLTRLQNEDVIMKRVMERPWFGWGGNRFIPAEIPNNFALDSAWVVILGSAGLVGLVSFYGLTTGIPIAVATWGKRHSSVYADRPQLLATVLTCLVAAAAYSIVADYSFPVLFVMLGAIVSSVAQHRPDRIFHHGRGL